ncbi:cytochrome P450 [Lindgomyces ingoldianus]|uniref:Cytochrome P450 n=1 Tax=Lindgomyces ingoldianus TaxID=673940 RepID=A0ACB6QD02_9PLEO|nr:cytochrome P450 [Lindgomyces ingoldianus]KAF2464777.1 cytochrome P450 [Lindgomyces ingoldianus]
MYHSASLTISVYIAALLVWRLVRFTLLPKLHPQEPREVPYWTPFLGHAVSYIRNPTKVLTDCRNYFHDDRKPFSITLAGKRLYIITAPQDVTTTCRNSSTLSMDIFTQDVMRGFDVSPWALVRVFQKPGEDFQLINSNPRHKSLAHLTMEHFRRQLFPGEKLAELGRITLDYINGAVRWECLSSPKFLLADAGEYREISLLHWCEDVLLQAATQSFFGSALIGLSPNLLDNFLAFDAVSWKLMYRLPRILSQDMEEQKYNLIKAIETYLDLPKEQRPGANWFTEMQEFEMRGLDISTRDIAKLISAIYWVINTNAYKLLFWMLAFLLQDEDLTATVTAELRAVFRSDGKLDIPSLQTHTPYLTALWYEALRLTNSSASARVVTSDTQLGPYVLRAGNRLLIPYHQLHRNVSTFGEDADKFDISRFLDDEKLPQNPSFRPFGGGVTYFPGRFLAKQEIFMAIAFLLCRFDVELKMDGNVKQKFPRMDEAKPGIGIVGPVKGDDLVIKLKPKGMVQ